MEAKYRLGRVVSKYIILEILAYSQPKALAIKELPLVSKNLRNLFIKNFISVQQIFNDLEIVEIDMHKDEIMFHLQSLKKSKFRITINDNNR